MDLTQLSKYFLAEDDEVAFYAVARFEIESGARRDGLWAKCLAEAEMSNSKAQSHYLKTRVKQFKGKAKELPSLCRKIYALTPLIEAAKERVAMAEAKYIAAKVENRAAQEIHDAECGRICSEHEAEISRHNRLASWSAAFGVLILVGFILLVVPNHLARNLGGILIVGPIVPLVYVRSKMGELRRIVGPVVSEDAEYRRKKSRQAIEDQLYKTMAASKEDLASLVAQQLAGIEEANELRRQVSL